jgi:hypothetical protein
MRAADSFLNFRGVRAASRTTVHLRSAGNQELRSRRRPVRLLRDLPRAAGQLMTNSTPFYPRTLSASEYVLALHSPEETSGRASLSNLQPASRLLSLSQRGCAGCCCTACLLCSVPCATRVRKPIGITDQLGIAGQVCNAVDKANKRLHGKRVELHFRDSPAPKSEEVEIAACN